MTDAAASLAPHPISLLPTYLRDWPAWAAWTAPVKRPLDLRRHLRPASTTDSDTWAGFSYALAHLERITSPHAPPSIPLPLGVGILVAPPLVFVDFDDLVSDPSSSAPEWAEEFLRQAAAIGAYTEWSASGTGAHAFIRTTPSFPLLMRNRYTRARDSSSPQAMGIEVYTSQRFAALTGFPYFETPSPTLNDPQRGDDLLRTFLAALSQHGAPVLTPPLPIAIPEPTPAIIRVAGELATTPILARAFEDPELAFTTWARDRHLRSLDDTRSAWRFHLYTVASRECPQSPQPIYELFNPSTTPQHPGIPEWQSFSHQAAKPHRRYADIQRAHALVVEEQRLLAIDLGEAAALPPPLTERTADDRPLEKPKGKKPRQPNVDLTESWAQLGLQMHVTALGIATPVVGSQNFIRLIQKHSHFQSYRIERNSLDGTTRCNRAPLPDTLATRFLDPIRQILGLKTDPPIDAVRAAIEVCADDAAYDPLHEYLTQLPEHDGQPRLSNWLESIGALPSHDLERFSRRIIIGLVARALNPKGVKFDYVPVFEGPSGVGKSTLVSLLVSEDFYGVLGGDLHTKDAVVNLRGKWGLEMGEMSAFKRSTDEARKAFFSTLADTFRPPYGRASVTVPRRCVLFGTTEDQQYLTDYRGNRRYWPIYFPRPIALSNFLSFRDQLFAEGLAAYRAGEQFHDTMEEMKAPERRQALDERLVLPAWQGRLVKYIEDLPHPHLPDADGLGSPGAYSATYLAELESMLNLPSEVQRMSDAQLAAFFRRAGYAPKSLSYRHNGRSTKTSLWVHPQINRLSDEQSKAFFSHFPALFRDGLVPPSWTLYRAGYLDDAIRILDDQPADLE